MDMQPIAYTRRTFLVTGAQCIHLGLVAILTTRFSFADETQRAGVQQTVLPLGQETTAKRLEGKLIAPCCFSQTVADHYSDVAAQIKRQIRQLLAQGQTEDQILDAYVQVYGERILAEPRARGFNLLAYLTPPLALIAGISGMFFMFTRWRRTGLTPSTFRQEATSPRDETAQRFRARLQDELSRFDG